MGYGKTWSTPRGVNLTWDFSLDPCDNPDAWSSTPGRDPFFICDSTNTTIIRIYMNNVISSSPMPAKQTDANSQS